MYSEWCVPGSWKGLYREFIHTDPLSRRLENTTTVEGIYLVIQSRNTYIFRTSNSGKSLTD